MSFMELFLLAVGLSMDAFAVSVCYGLTMRRATLGKMFVPGLYFGFFQFLMPVIGFLAATMFAERIIAYDHWIAFALLAFLGGKMVYGSFEKEEGCTDRCCPAGSATCEDRTCPGGKRPAQEEASLKPAQMLPAALATSIDALAVGVSLAFLRVVIIPAASFIGVTTLLFSMSGVKIGSIFGSRFKAKAEILGGVILGAIGAKILLEHLGILVL
jgi:putative Mn2+ efflux pump MntP